MWSSGKVTEVTFAKNSPELGFLFDAIRMNLDANFLSVFFQFPPDGGFGAPSERFIEMFERLFEREAARFCNMVEHVIERCFFDSHTIYLPAAAFLAAQRTFIVADRFSFRSDGCVLPRSAFATLSATSGFFIGFRSPNFCALRN